jgi:hypothetical protein
MLNDDIHPNADWHAGIAQAMVNAMSDYNRHMLWLALPWYRKLWFNIKVLFKK